MSYFIHTVTHACMHACMHAWIHTYIHTYIYMCTYICMYYIHTYIHIHGLNKPTEYMPLGQARPYGFGGRRLSNSTASNDSNTTAACQQVPVPGSPKVRRILAQSLCPNTHMYSTCMCIYIYIYVRTHKYGCTYTHIYIGSKDYQGPSGLRFRIWGQVWASSGRVQGFRNVHI